MSTLDQFRRQYDVWRLFTPLPLFDSQILAATVLRVPGVSRLLLFHSTGSGKTLACVHAAVSHYCATGHGAVVVTRGDPGELNFRAQVALYQTFLDARPMGLHPRTPTDVATVFRYEHYMALHRKIGPDVTSERDAVIRAEYDGMMLVFDEIHGVRGSVSDGALRRRGRRRQQTESDEVVYDSILRMVNVCVRSKVIYATATPMVDTSEQIVPINRLLGDAGIVSFDDAVRNKPEIVFVGEPNDDVVGAVHTSRMVGHQAEACAAMLTTPGRTDHIHLRSRQLSLFALPGGARIEYDEEIRPYRMGPVRPDGSVGNPRDFSVTFYRVKAHQRAYLRGAPLRDASSKYHEVVSGLAGSVGKKMVYLEEVVGPGVLLFAEVLRAHGYDEYVGGPLTSVRRRFTICVGSSKVCPNMQDRLNAFNSVRNDLGAYIEIIVVSAVLGESVGLRGVQEVNLMVPAWNYPRMLQTMARCVRTNSHTDYPPDMRTVRVHVHVARFADPSIVSVDEMALSTCRRKYARIAHEERELRRRSIETYLATHAPATVEECDPDRFVRYYMDEYYAYRVDTYAELLQRRPVGCDVPYFVTMSDPVRPDHPVVATEILARMVRSDRIVRYRGESHVVREDIDGTFYLNANLSSPHRSPRYVVPTLTRSSRAPAAHALRARCEPQAATPLPRTVPEAAAYVRTASMDEKIRLFETHHPFDTTTDPGAFLAEVYRYLCCEWTDDDGRTVYAHIMRYRELRNAYRSVIPVPNDKNRTRSTRIKRGDDGAWTNIDDDRLEKTVFARIRAAYAARLKDTTTGRFRGEICIVSHVDGAPRLQRGPIVEHDARYTYRGRAMSSMKRDGLVDRLAGVLSREAASKLNVKQLSEQLVDLYASHGARIYV